MDPFLGEIRLFGGTFAPRGWSLCDGKTLPIQQNTALFSLFGTLYGGDGRSTFGLPDLRARIPIGQGAGVGVSPRTAGQVGGELQETLVESQVAPHNHDLVAAPDPASQRIPGQPVSLAVSNPGTIYQTETRNNLVPLAPELLPPIGGGGPHDNTQPYLVLNYIVAVEGLFPARS